MLNRHQLLLHAGHELFESESEFAYIPTSQYPADVALTYSHMATSQPAPLQHNGFLLMDMLDAFQIGKLLHYMVLLSISSNLLMQLYR